MPKDLKSLLPLKFIRLVQHKLETGEMTPEECQEIMKEMMVREYERKQTEKAKHAWKLSSWLKDQADSCLQKLWNRPLAQPTIGTDELAGTLRSRHF